MKTINWLPIAMAAALLAGGSIRAQSNAAEPTARPSHQRGQWLERAKEQLGLTDEQVQKVKAELGTEKDTLKDLISNLHDARIGLREVIQAAGANETTVRAASAKVASVEADLAVERLRLYERISPILTSEQLEKLKQFRSKLDDLVDRAIDRMGERLNSQ